MKKQIGSIAAAIILSAGISEGAHLWEDPNDWWYNNFRFAPEEATYSAHEISADLFASFIGDDSSFGDGDFGGGLGLNYFLTREIGLGTDVNISADGGSLIDMVNLSGIYRLPIKESGFAPYVYGGGGKGIDPDWQWLGHLGLGVEFRLNPNIGVFTDARYIWASESSERVLIRAGLRLIF